MKRVTAAQLRKLSLFTGHSDMSTIRRYRECADALDEKDARIAQLETVIRLLGRCHQCDGSKIQPPHSRPGPCMACDGTGVVSAASEAGVT